MVPFITRSSCNSLSGAQEWRLLLGLKPGNLGPPLWHDKKTPSFHRQPWLEARMQTWVAVGSGLESHWDV